MDVRAVLCFWRTKPVAMDTGNHSVAVMKQSVFHGDGSYGNTGRSTRIWGDCYSPLETWMDIDRGIKNELELRDYITVKIYLDAMIEIHGYNWERWKALPYYIVKQLQEIVYNIQKGE